MPVTRALRSDEHTAETVLLFSYSAGMFLWWNHGRRASVSTKPRPQQRSQDSDLSSAARPPSHIPLPPPVSAERESEHFPSNTHPSRSSQQKPDSAGGEEQVESTAGVAQIIKTHVAAQRWMHHRIWAALAQKQWPLFESLLSSYWSVEFRLRAIHSFVRPLKQGVVDCTSVRMSCRKCGLKYDEVTYTLKLHGYILCHRQKPEKAFLVIEEMKAAGMHPAIIRLNEAVLTRLLSARGRIHNAGRRMSGFEGATWVYVCGVSPVHLSAPQNLGIVISQMELQDIFCGLPADAYQNLCKLAFHSAIKVQRQRRMRLRERLLATPPQKLFAMTYRDVLALLDEQERALCFPDDALSLIAAGDATNASALKANAGFLELCNQALGFEDPSDPAGLLEGAQPNSLIADLP
ncbi:hypothetical protein Esti_005605 [Eimeria stiedai]